MATHHEFFRFTKWLGTWQRRRWWLVAGMFLGLLMPISIIGYERVWLVGYVRPLTKLFLWPTSFFTQSFWGGSSSKAALVLALVGNGVLFALIVAALRRATVILALGIIVLVWFYRSPSDSALVQTFIAHKPEFELLVRLSPNIMDQRSEQLRLMHAANLKMVYRDASGKQVFLVTRASTIFGPFDSYYGFVYCPSSEENAPLGGYVPCTEKREAINRTTYRYKRLDATWYIYEVFQKYSAD